VFFSLILNGRLPGRFLRFSSSVIFKEINMPKVGKKKFPYTKKGKAAAKKAMKKRKY